MLEDYEPKDLVELADEARNDDEARAIEAYRRQRMAEMQLEQRRARFGRVYPIGRDDYTREVTEASKADEEGEEMAGKGTGVVCFLYNRYVSRLFAHCMRLTRRPGAVKFLVNGHSLICEHWQNVILARNAFRSLATNAFQTIRTRIYRRSLFIGKARSPTNRWGGVRIESEASKVCFLLRSCLSTRG